jgi:hypothetical protein
MPQLTQRDLVDSISGLRLEARKLRAAGEPDEATEKVAGRGSVLVDGAALQRTADYLDRVADELQTLIPDKPVKPPPP